MRIRIVSIALLVALFVGCPPSQKPRVVVYTSLDQIFSEDILEGFEQKTGIEVKVVYDTEASKTTGLVNRLIAEKDSPRADVFWNSEVGRTIVLKEKGVLAPYKSPMAQGIPENFKDSEGYWTGFAARARILIYNKETLAPEEKPGSVLDLTAPRFKGKVTMANPMFGTTSTHVAAWFALLGPEKAKAFLLELLANDLVIVPGNSTSRDRVVAGDYPLGFTDTDDASLAIGKGAPVGVIYPDKEGMGALLIPNTAALIANGPNPENGQKLIDYLLSPEVEEKLAFSGSAQMPLRAGVPTPDNVPAYKEVKAMDVDFNDIAANMEEAMKFCHENFVR